ncbi:YkvA family protein [Shewanella sp. GXUN23E]|uniref:YkvA family protein n=1 Tax=Shewanella sp. GXUN23E TaxID=3422498 RepID=UPI003D7E0D0D
MSEDAFTEQGFWRKLTDYARSAGREVVEKALWLYYAAQRPDTPKWARAVIYGALGYFIMPLDAIPDLTPMMGFTDDLGALAAAIGMVSLFIDEQVKAKSAQTMTRWFGD